MIGRAIMAAGVAAAVTAAPAGAADRRDGATFEDPLAAQITKALSTQVTDVSRCPAKVVLAPGRTFHCRVQFASGDLTRVRVRITGRDGGFRWHITGVPMRALEERMERTMAEIGDPGQVLCPFRARVQKGATFRCYGVNTPRTRKYYIDAVQLGGGIVRYTAVLQP